MRRTLAKQDVEPLLHAIGQRASGPGAVYFVGGICAVWFNWRDSTVDVELALAPEPAGMFGVLESLKRELNVNIELASPAQFVPPLPGWQGRSPFILRAGLVDFYHYDFYSQAFAKLSRAHARDEVDVRAMVSSGQVDPVQLLQLVDQIVPEMVRYPHLDGKSLRQRIATWSLAHGA